MLDFQAQRWFSDAFRQQEPATVARVSDILLRNDVECYAATCVMLGDADLRGFQSSIRVPVAVVVGEEDYATPVAAAEALQRGISGSTLKILKGRHITPIELPGDIADELQALAIRAYGKA